MKYNLSRYESVVRITLGAAIIIVGVHYEYWWSIPLAMVLLYTAVFRFCPLYLFAGINVDEAKKNFYIAQIPKYNPEPVCLFDSKGRLQYRNESAETVLPNLDNVSELIQSKGESLRSYLDKNASFFERFETDDRNYLVHFKAVSEIESVVAYAFNVTDIVKINEEIINTQKELVYRMGEIGETRSQETGNHVKRVAEYSRILADMVGLGEEEAEILKMASPMHDIGKVAIPDGVLKKPGKLDAEEWEIMKKHATIGYELLRHSDRPILKAAAIVAGEHHEKWDGSGYPNGIQGDKIHIYGRITAVADVFDALGSDRVYKKAWPLERILALFQEERGKHFDPELTDMLLQNLDPFLAIRDRYQDVVHQPQVG